MTTSYLPEYVYYAKCCRVWPLVIGYRVGRCGLCHEVPEDPATREEYEAQASARHRMRLLVQCEKCGGASVVYRGDEVSVPFQRLPEFVANAVDTHQCKERDATHHHP